MTIPTLQGGSRKWLSRKGIMSTTQKNAVRIFVLAALMVWPAVETWRLAKATEALTQSIDQERAVSHRLAYLKSIQVPGVKDAVPDTVPVSTPAK